MMCSSKNLMEICGCKVMVNECIVKQHRMVVCKMALMGKKNRESKAKDTMVETEGASCQDAFRQEVTRTLGGKDDLLDEWDKTAEILRKTADTVLRVTFGKRK